MGQAWPRLTLVLILVVAVFLRAWGIGYDLPYVYHPDEPVYVEISQRIFKTGDLNPRFFNYPSLFFYVHAAAYVPYYLLGRYLGPFNSPEDVLAPIRLTMGVVKSPMPTTVLMGRMITLAFGVGCVVLTFVAAKVLTEKGAVALLAAVMMATSPVNVWNNRWITPDTLVTFFALASFVASVFVLRQGRTWHYAVAGVCIGLTASSKYNGALIVATLLVAHFLRSGLKGFRSRDLYVGLFLSGFAFVATTPFAVLDFATFIDDLRFEAQHYLRGRAGMEGNTLRWYAGYLWASTGPLCLLAVGELVDGAIHRRRETMLTGVFPLTYFIFINRFVVRNARTIMPLTPFLYLLAALLLVRLFCRAGQLRSEFGRRGSRIALMGLTAASLVVPFTRTVRTNQRLTGPNSREMAREWISDHLGPGSKIAVESYGPFIDPDSFSVHGFVRIIDRDLSWYVEKDFDYVVFSRAMYGRFYRDTSRYASEVADYNVFFEELALVREFTTDGDAVRIYRVSK